MANLPKMYSLKATTPWVHLGGLDGYQRVWYVVVRGKRYAGETSVAVTVRVAHDYNPTYVQERIYNADADAAAFAEELVFRLQVKNQACSAIRVQVVSDTPNNQKDFALTGITLEYGALPLHRRLRKAASL